MLTSAGHEMEKSHTLVAAGLGVRYPRQTVQLEPHSVAPLAPVHVVPEGQDQLQHPPQTFTPLNFFAGLQDRQYFWLDLIVPDIELLFVMQGPQSLFIVRYPGINKSRQRTNEAMLPSDAVEWFLAVVSFFLQTKYEK